MNFVEDEIHIGIPQPLVSQLGIPFVFSSDLSPLVPVLGCGARSPDQKPTSLCEPGLCPSSSWLFLLSKKGSSQGCGLGRLGM